MISRQILKTVGNVIPAYLGLMNALLPDNQRQKWIADYQSYYYILDYQSY